MPSIISVFFGLFSLLFIYSKPCFAQVLFKKFSSYTSSDWVVIYNPSEETADLQGYVIEDEISQVTEIDCLLEGEEYLTVSYSNRLNRAGDVVILKNAEGEIVDCFSYGTNKTCLGQDTTDLRGLEEGEYGVYDIKKGAWEITTDSQGENYDNCLAPTSTLTPTPTPTNPPTNTPEPTDEPINNEPTINIDINNQDNIKVGVMFYVDCSFSGLKPNQDYRLKVVIGEDPDDRYKGQTKSGDEAEWLSDNSSWDLFPHIKTNDQGDYDKVKTLRARVKDGNPAGKYFLKVSALEESNNHKINSSQKEFEVQAEPTPIPTVEPTQTPLPSPKPSLSATPTDKPTAAPTETLLTAEADKADNGKNSDLESGEVLGETAPPKENNFNKYIALGLITIGGGCLSVVGGWPYIEKIFAKIKKDEN